MTSGSGFDAGTYNLISCRRNEAKDFVYKKEVNAFLEFPCENDYVFKMMKQAGVALIERPDDKIAYALGDAAIQMAYTMAGIELKRPMKDGCVNPKEKDAFQILNIMIHSLIGDIQDREILYFSVPANAINESTDADYHRKILEAIFKAYKDKDGNTVDYRPINEGMALVYAEMKNKMFTGIGVSCLCPGTKIYTNRGILNIEDVKEGDLVITHQGRWKPINEVIKKKFSGVMTKIQVGGYADNTEKYKFVDNHELYVKRDGMWNWLGCEELEKGDIVGEPILKRDRDIRRPKINVCERVTCSKIWQKYGIEVSANVQRLMGYFLSDGSVNESEGCIQFDFTSHEKNNIEDVQEILKRAFNKSSSETVKSENCVRIKCYSKGLVSWFSNHCYDKNREKQYPWKLDRISDSDCRNLLAGLIRGDGNWDDNEITFSNTSTNLIILAKQLFSRCGFAASITSRPPRDHYYKKEGRLIEGKKEEWCVSTGKSTAQISLRDFIEDADCDSSYTVERTFIEDGFCCSKVQNTKHEDYDGWVYDLQIEDDHSFSGPFMTIHNCGAGMVNVAFSLFGAEVFTFSLVNSGDWIDKRASEAAQEPIPVINKIKHEIDLNKEPETLVERAIKTQYELMIERTIGGIKAGLQNNQDKKARLDHPIDVVVAGGTACPPGFDDLFRKLLKNEKLPIDIGEVIRPADPINSVARGCLIAAENAGG